MWSRFRHYQASGHGTLSSASGIRPLQQQLPYSSGCPGQSASKDVNVIERSLRVVQQHEVALVSHVCKPRIQQMQGIFSNKSPSIWHSKAKVDVVVGPACWYSPLFSRNAITKMSTSDLRVQFATPNHNAGGPSLQVPVPAPLGQIQR